MKMDRNIVILILATGFFLVLLLFINHEDKSIPYIPKIYVENSTSTVEKSSSNYTVIVPKDVCEGCHMSDKPFIPQAKTLDQHKNGGAYCLSCHVISHEKHPINDNVTCEKCHAGATRPVYTNGYIPCNDCHNYPDPLIPSEGNIITIHRPRGITCNTCHTNTCTNCHSEMGTGEKWEKRLDHFSVVAKRK